MHRTGVPGPAPPDGQKDLLIHVFGQLGVAHGPQGHVQHVATVSVHQLFESTVRQFRTAFWKTIP